MESPSGGGAVSLTYAKEASIDMSFLLFANPGNHTRDMVLRVVIQNTAVIKSGRLTPRYQVTTLNLLKDAEKFLAIGVYEGKSLMLCYNRQSGEKTMVNTEIPVAINATDKKVTFRGRGECDIRIIFI